MHANNQIHIFFYWNLLFVNAAPEKIIDYWLTNYWLNLINLGISIYGVLVKWRNTNGNKNGLLISVPIDHLDTLLDDWALCKSRASLLIITINQHI